MSGYPACIATASLVRSKKYTHGTARHSIYRKAASKRITHRWSYLVQLLVARALQVPQVVVRVAEVLHHIAHGERLGLHRPQPVRTQSRRTQARNNRGLETAAPKRDVVDGATQELNDVCNRMGLKLIVPYPIINLQSLGSLLG